MITADSRSSGGHLHAAQIPCILLFQIVAGPACLRNAKTGAILCKLTVKKALHPHPCKSWECVRLQRPGLRDRGK